MFALISRLFAVRPASHPSVHAVLYHFSMLSSKESGLGLQISPPFSLHAVSNTLSDAGHLERC